MAGVPAPVVAATPAFAQASPPSCHNPPGWKPTDLELHHILAKHRGWLSQPRVIPRIELQVNDEYLDRVNPDWRHEARSHPEPANLCYADLLGAHLDGAALNGADLSGADLRDAHLEHAHLLGAHLDARTWATRTCSART
jgi:hypothetical protein